MDDTHGIPEVAQQRIVENYHVVSSDEPRFGDLVFLVRSDGQIVHTAVYLAASLVYSKNDMNLRSPWTVTTLGDTLNTYSPDPDDHMQLQFWRRNE